ncbi:MAG: hypothetical protein SGPRY_014785, partial [Prymnesium sp.]
ELSSATRADAKVLLTPAGKLSTDAAEQEARGSGGGEGGEEEEDYEAEVRAALKRKEALAAAKTAKGGKPEKKGPSKQVSNPSKMTPWLAPLSPKTNEKADTNASSRPRSDGSSVATSCSTASTSQALPPPMRPKFEIHFLL